MYTVEVVYVVRTYIDPFQADECPMYVFDSEPSRQNVWDLVKKWDVVKENSEDGKADEEDWDWHFDITKVKVRELK